MVDWCMQKILDITKLLRQKIAKSAEIISEGVGCILVAVFFCIIEICCYVIEMLCCFEISATVIMNWHSFHWHHFFGALFETSICHGVVEVE